MKRPCAGTCGKNREERFFSGPRGNICVDCRKATRRRANRIAHLRKRYDISLEEYEALLAAQGGVCAACGEGRSYNLHVDHDHKIERTHGIRASIRGLCCAGCNKVFRDVRDNIPRLRSMALYLQSPPARGIIE